MSDREKLTMLRDINKSSDSDDVLLTYLQLAGQKIINKAYPFGSSTTEVPSEYSILQVDIALYLLNKRGAEGQEIHIENGVHRTYESADVPNSMLRAVTARCGVPL